MATSFALGWVLCACTDPANGDPTTPRSEPGATEPAALPADPQAAIATLLKECHGVLQGEARMASSLLNMRHSEHDDLPEQVILWTQDRMRIVRRNRQIDIRLPQGAWRLTPHASAAEHSPEKTSRLDRLQSLLRAALLEPLYRTQTATRVSPSLYQLTLADGAVWELEVRAFQPKQGRAVFLPWRLKGPPGSVVWHRYLHTGVTHLPEKMGLGEFGDRFVSLEASDLTLDEGWFSDPLSPGFTTPNGRGSTISEASTDVGSRDIPWIGFTRASRSVVIKDPGSWPERATRVNKEARRLFGQGQEGDDLEFLFEQDGVAYYAIPFMMRRDGGRPFVAEPDQVILRLPRQRAVLLRTSARNIAEARASALAILDKFVKANKLEASGPLRTRPFVEMERLIQGELAIEEVEVQLELPIKAP